MPGHEHGGSRIGEVKVAKLGAQRGGFVRVEFSDRVGE